MRQLLREFVSPTLSNTILESAADYDETGKPTGGKSLYMKGIFIQGGVKNANQRVYPVSEISRAVKTVNDQITGGYSILGECDHPADLKINLDRVSHIITEMWMDGANGYGKLKILPTPMGNIIKTMLESGVKLGVSSRGSGDVDDNGSVKGFEIITVDVVSSPSAPGAYPTPIYEHFMNTRGGYQTMQFANEVRQDPAAQKILKESIMTIIKGLK